MTDPVPSPAALEEHLAGLADIVNNLIGVVSRLDDETAAAAAAAFDSNVPGSPDTKQPQKS
jgi:hypothetical protein